MNRHIMHNSPDLAYEPVVGFQSRKAAQISAYFVAQSGGRIDKLKLAKLQYLSEREFLARFQRPMLYDELYSLPHGPICSSALNGVEGKLGNREEWEMVKAHGARDIHGPKNIGRNDLDEVSDAEFETVEAVWTMFGGMSAGEIRNYTHDPKNCPEYTEVVGSRVRISYEDVLRALGNPNASELAAQVDEFRRLELTFQAS